MREAFMKFNYMTTSIGCLPIDSTGMRKLSDALDEANAKLKEYEEKETEGNREDLLCWSKQGLYPDGFGGVKVGYTCPYCKKYVPYAGKYCGKCGERVAGGDE